MSEQPTPTEPGASSTEPSSLFAPPANAPPVPLESNPRQSGRRWWWVGAGGVVVVFAAIGLLWRSGSWEQRPTPVPEDTPPAFPVPPLSSSPFRNTGPEGRYVGSDSCNACHKSRAASFRRTGMGCSMAEVDPAHEPADAVFDHAKSKRRYQITRKDGQLWHRELLLANEPKEVVLSEYPLKYVVGSGRHGRTYLVEADGFLVESPVTWYASTKAWGMSPGYDQAHHQGFERPIGESCLVCHAGHAEAVGQSQNRMRVKEAAISCERCHGPGSLHVELHTNRKGKGKAGAGLQSDGIDYTIVNPSHLPRERAEAVCQQCHLHSAAAVPGRGRKPSDFRPGLPLTDFRQDYEWEMDNAPMTVVGHVEQMHLSRCYQESKTLTCTTCHNPHAFPAPEKRVDHYRASCLQCHQLHQCKVPRERLLRESPVNNCVQCHMPSSDTDIPHVAFTHHRIGVHEKPAKQTPQGDGARKLKPLMTYDLLGEADKKRSLGLAYLDLALEERQPALATDYKGRGFDLLSAVHVLGLRDPVLEAKLSRLYFERGQDESLPLAHSALASETLTGQDRCTALFVLASERLKRRQFHEARAAFRELVTLRRHPHDWLLLADCEKALGNRAAAVAALQAAVRIDPRLVQVHQFLAQHFRQQGDAQRAAWHQQRAVP